MSLHLESENEPKVVPNLGQDAYSRLQEIEGPEAEQLRMAVDAVIDVQDVVNDPRSPKHNDTISAWKSSGHFWRLFDSAHEDKLQRVTADTQKFIDEELPRLVHRLESGYLSGHDIVAGMSDELASLVDYSYGIDEDTSIRSFARHLAEHRSYNTLAELAVRHIPELGLERAKILDPSFGRTELREEAESRAQKTVTDYAERKFGEFLESLEGDHSAEANAQRSAIEHHLALKYQETLLGEAAMLAADEISIWDIPRSERALLREVRGINGFNSYRWGDVKENVFGAVESGTEAVVFTLAGGVGGLAAKSAAGALVVKGTWGVAARVSSARASHVLSKYAGTIGTGVGTLAVVPGFIGTDQVLGTMLRGEDPKSLSELTTATGYAYIASAMTGIAGKVLGAGVSRAAPEVRAAYNRLKEILGPNDLRVKAAESVEQTGALVGGLVLTNIISRGELPSDAREAYDLLASSTKQAIGLQSSRAITGMASRALMSRPPINVNESFRVGDGGSSVTVYRGGPRQDGASPYVPPTPPPANDLSYPGSEPMVVNGSNLPSVTSVEAVSSLEIPNLRVVSDPNSITMSSGQGELNIPPAERVNSDSSSATVDLPSLYERFRQGNAISSKHPFKPARPITPSLDLENYPEIQNATTFMERRRNPERSLALSWGADADSLPEEDRSGAGSLLPNHAIDLANAANTYSNEPTRGNLKLFGEARQKFLDTLRGNGYRLDESPFVDPVLVDSLRLLTDSYYAGENPVGNQLGTLEGDLLYLAAASSKNMPMHSMALQQSLGRLSEFNFQIGRHDLGNFTRGLVLPMSRYQTNNLILPLEASFDEENGPDDARYEDRFDYETGTEKAGITAVRRVGQFLVNYQERVQERYNSDAHFRLLTSNRNAATTGIFSPTGEAGRFTFDIPERGGEGSHVIRMEIDNGMPGHTELSLRVYKRVGGSLVDVTNTYDPISGTGGQRVSVQTVYSGGVEFMTPFEPRSSADITASLDKVRFENGPIQLSFPSGESVMLNIRAGGEPANMLRQSSEVASFKGRSVSVRDVMDSYRNFTDQLMLTERYLPQATLVPNALMASDKTTSTAEVITFLQSRAPVFEAGQNLRNIISRGNDEYDSANIFTAKDFGRKIAELNRLGLDIFIDPSADAISTNGDPVVLRFGNRIHIGPNTFNEQEVLSRLRQIQGEVLGQGEFDL